MWLSLKSYTHVLVCFFVNVTTCPKLQFPSSSKLFSIYLQSLIPVLTLYLTQCVLMRTDLRHLLIPWIHQTSTLYILWKIVQALLKTYYYAHVLKHSINVSKMSKNTNVDDKLSSLIIHLQSKRTLPFLQSNFKKCRTNKSPYLTKVRLCFRITHRRTYYFVETLLELSTQMHSKSKEISPIMRRGNIRQKKEIL